MVLELLADELLAAKARSREPCGGTNCVGGGGFKEGGGGESVATLGERLEMVLVAGVELTADVLSAKESFKIDSCGVGEIANVLGDG